MTSDRAGVMKASSEIEKRNIVLIMIMLPGNLD
jgi:hypothetical protein